MTPDKLSNKRQQGFALITALGVMVILMGVIGILVISSIGDLQQSRSSIQLSQARAVAEAGIAVGHDALQGTGNNGLQAILNGYSTTFASANNNPTTTWVVPQSNWTTLASSLETTLNNTAISNTVSSSALNGAGSVNVKYQLSNFRGLLLATTAASSTQSYVMDYTITSTGSANGGTRNVIEQGSFQIQMGQGSLSQYLFLINNSGGQTGYYDSSSFFNGPVHSNTSWGFKGNPQFLGAVTTSSNATFYHCNGNVTLVAASSNPPCSSPIYAQGFQFAQPTVPLPTSALGQARAALGLNPAVLTNGVPTAPTNVEICQRLNLTPTCPANVAAPATGVYLPNDSTNITGGIYIQGNVNSMTLIRPAAGQQQYVIVQGTTTSTILVNYNNNTTTITTNPGGTTSYTGTPNGQAPIGTGGANGQIFVNGTISGLTGPARSAAVTANSPQHPVPTGVGPALAKETQLNITATGQVGVSGDLTYECDPTRLSTPSYITANPNCNMNGQPLNTVLGVMSTTQNVQVSSNAPNDVYLWGSYYTSTVGTGLTVQGVTGANRNNPPTRGNSGTMHLFGGIIQDTDQVRGIQNSSGTLTNGFNESFDYDSRFINGAVTPPNFPTKRVFVATVGAPVALTFSEK
jgi:Tfp pilus assembly protein PilX